MPIQVVIGIIIIAAVIIYFIAKPRKKTSDNKSKTKDDLKESAKTEEPLCLKGAYQKKWMFSYNEKDAFTKIKAIAEKHNYHVFAKVRLLDLLEPIKGNPKYKTYFYKIQSKHVDFVLCDPKLIARFIIELDDNSHDQKSRQDRDTFIDTILQDVGYKILHIRGIEERTIEALFHSE